MQKQLNSAGGLSVKKALLSLLIPTLMTHTAIAEETSENTVTLEEMVVILDKKAKEKVGEKIVTNKDIKEQLIQDNRDLVRYNPEVAIAETGRFGSKGFAIRGVDENRVAMSVDGVSLPELEVNQIYLPYGYMYGGRLAVDPEIMKSISIQTGADSLTSGSGALGGAVNYATKEPKNLLKAGKSFGGYAKIGYANKNEEKMAAVGLAGRTEKFEGLINYVHRDGHELKNHRMLSHNSDKLNIDYPFPEEEVGVKGVLPDTSHYHSHNTLAKLYYHINDEHRVGIFGNHLSKKDHSYVVTKGTYSSQRRMGHDEAKLQSYGFSYRYAPSQSMWLEQLDAEFARQKVEGIAHTDVRTPNWRTERVDPAESYTEEHRPTSDITKQFKITTNFMPLELGKFGSHKFNSILQYADKDYSAIPSDGSVCPGKSKYLCNGQDYISRDTFVYIPNVKRNIASLVVSDDVELSDKLGLQLGLRYDYFKYKPYLNAYQQSLIHGPHKDAGYGHLQNKSHIYKPENQWLNPSELAKDKEYRTNFQKTFNEKNPATEDKFTGRVGLNYNINNNWQAQYKFSTGFLMPTITQMYSNFNGLGVMEIPGFISGLRPETSKNHEIEFKGNFEQLAVKLGVYQTNYKDFINIRFANERIKDRNHDTITYYNVDSAKTYGGRLGVTWDISRLAKLNGQLQLIGEYATSKDSTSAGTNLIANIPQNGIFGFDYRTPNDNLDLHGRIRYVGAKKAKDAKIDSGRGGITVSDYLPYSKSYTIVDLYGTKRFNNGFSLSAGVYNIFNKQYHSWEVLRTFMGAKNINFMVDDKHVGLQRYTAPGRNFNVALSYEF